MDALLSVLVSIPVVWDSGAGSHRPIAKGVPRHPGQRGSN